MLNGCRRDTRFLTRDLLGKGLTFDVEYDRFVSLRGLSPTAAWNGDTCCASGRAADICEDTEAELQATVEAPRKNRALRRTAAA